MRHGTESSGAFSMAFSGPLGIAIGGDYQKPALSRQNVAITHNRGKTWTVPKTAMTTLTISKTSATSVPDAVVGTAGTVS